jgi:hypothetical protein
VSKFLHYGDKTKKSSSKGFFFLGRGKREKIKISSIQRAKKSSITEAHPFCVHVQEKIIRWGSSSVSKGKSSISKVHTFCISIKQENHP